MSDNPYQTPNAELETNDPGVVFNLGQPKSVAIGRGWSWIAEGFGFFKKSALHWILTTIVGFVIMMVMGLIPVIGQIGLMLTSYVWLGGLMLGCRAQDEGKPFELKYLFAGFSTGVGKLVLLSLVIAIISVAIMFMAMGSMYWSMISGDPAAGEAMMNDMAGFWLSFLIAMALMLPIFMAVWFAPSLIVLHDVSIIEAMKLSFIGCLKNVLPFIIYGIVALVLYFVAVIPLLLGLLVLMPTLFASMYVAYKDIYLE